ncbi:MAG: hypothetical protein JWN76_194 [Chitinophagaceae bacterium]|nr:hypothetical protein [Chitinophagaceae bacterium]
MKKIKSLFMICCLTGVFAACEKNSSTAWVTKIETSKTELKAGESINVQIQNPNAGSVSRWTIQPSLGTSIDSVYSVAKNVVRFTQPGTYVINAEMRTVHPDCRPSPRYDTCFFNGLTSQKLATTVTVKN